MCCTGDLVCLLPNRLLDFKGYIKSFSSCIQLRSYRIELNETCIVLESHNIIDRAIAMVDELRQQLVAILLNASVSDQANANSL